MLENRKVKIEQVIAVILYTVGCYFLNSRISTIVAASLILAVLILLDINMKNKSMVVILAMFSGSYIAFQGIISYRLVVDIIKKRCSIHRNKTLMGYLIVCIIATIVGFRGKETIIAMILYVGTTIITFYAYFIFKKESREEITKTYNNLCLAQIIVVLLQIVPEFMQGTFHPDSTKGTFSSCVILVIVLFVNMLLVIVDKEKNKKIKYLETSLYLAIILIADAKIVFVILIFAIVSTFILYKVKTVKHIKAILLMIFMLIVGVGIFNKPIWNKISNTPLANYITTNGVNLKYRAFEYSFRNIKGLDNIIGIGVGQFGSKAANALAYDEMYKTDDSLKLPGFIKPQTHEIYKPIAQLSTKEYYDVVSYYSAILSYPQSSIVTIKGETGYVGLIYVYGAIMFYIAYILRKRREMKFGFLAIVMLVFLAIAMIFDNFLDMNIVMATIFLCMALVRKQERKHEKINITYVLSELKIGGAEKLVEVLIEKFNKNEFEVSLIVLGNKEENELYYNLKNIGIKIYYCNKEGKDFLKTSRQVSKYINICNSDIVHVHTSIVHLVAYGLIENEVKGRVYTIHSMPSYDSPGMKRWIYGALFKVLNFDIIAISKVIENESKSYFNEKNISTINNCIDIKKFASKIEIEKRNQRRILHVGRFVEVKNQGLLIDVAKSMDDIDYKLTFVGDGETLNKNKEKVKNYNLEKKVEFLGRRGDIKDIMDDHSIFVLCSDIEGAPISIIEAMANGMAIIATDVGGVRDFIEDDVNGCIVEKGNKEKLEEKILELINNPQKIIKLSREAKKRAKKYSIHTCIKEHEILYKEIIRK